MLNPQSDEFREGVSAAEWLNVAIRESLVNPVLIALINLHGKHTARDSSELKRNKTYPVRADNLRYESSRYFQFLISGTIHTIGIKYSDSQLYERRFAWFCRYISKILIIEWDERSLELQREFAGRAKPEKRIMNKIEYISPKEFFLRYLSENEYNYFLTSTRNAIQEARKIIGIESIHVSAPSYMHEFKQRIKKDLSSINLENSVFHFIGRNNQIFDKQMTPLMTEQANSDTDIQKIQKAAIHANGFSVLLGTSGFAKCFITSEYLFSIFKNGGHSVEYTPVVCGYFKCIEQLLYRIMKKLLSSGLYENASIKAGGGFNYLSRALKDETQRKRDQGMDRKHVPFQAAYESAFDVTLNPLISLLEGINGIWNVTEQGKAHIISWLRNYADNCRNEHFHKDNILELEEVELIRDNTIELSLLLLGSLRLPGGLDGLDAYDDTFDGLIEILQKTKSPIVYYVQFDDEILKVHRHFDEPVPEMDLNGNAENVEIEFVRIDSTDEIWHETNEAYNEWFEAKPKVIISKNHIPSKIWYEKRGGSHERVLIWPTTKSDFET